MDRKDLKIEALLQRVASLTAEYENRVADLRVELTEQAQQNADLQGRVAELEQERKSLEESTENTEADYDNTDKVS